MTATLEAAIPTSKRIDRYIRKVRPDVVLVSPVVKMGSNQVEFLKSAQRLGIPAATCVASWDNLTSKGLLRRVPQRVFVWNEVQRREAIELHGMPASRVVATGAPRFDSWFEQRPSSSQEEFAVRIGLDPARPTVLFLGSSPFVTRRADREVTFVRRWVESLRASDHELLPHVGILIRPHPTGTQWHDVDLSEYENVVIWPPRPARPASAEARADFFDSITHSAAVVGINTTAMIEAAIAGKSVLTILDQKFAQENTLHFHYLLAENGGFLHVASSLTEHMRQLAAVLDGKDDQADRRAGFVESFIRPHGLERPVTPIFADEVEELASARVERVNHSRRLRLMLRMDLPLSSLALLCYPARRGIRRLRRRIRGQLPSRSPAP